MFRCPSLAHPFLAKNDKSEYYGSWGEICEERKY